LDLPFPVAGIDHKKSKATIIGNGNTLFSLTHLEDIGRYVAAILQRPAETKNRIIRVAGDTQCANALVQKFEKKTGRKFKVKYESEIVMNVLLKAAWEHKKYGVYFEKAIDVFAGDGVFQFFEMYWLVESPTWSTCSRILFQTFLANLVLGMAQPIG